MRATCGTRGGGVNGTSTRGKRGGGRGRRRNNQNCDANATENKPEIMIIKKPVRSNLSAITGRGPAVNTGDYISLDVTKISPSAMFSLPGLEGPNFSRSDSVNSCLSNSSGFSTSSNRSSSSNINNSAHSKGKD